MKSCNLKILELFYNAKHTGRISKPEAIGRVGKDDEGLVIEITWRVSGGVIIDAKFRAFANPNAIAITSLMTDNMIGKTVDDVLLMGEEVIVDNLGEFKPEYLEVYDMVRQAIGEAYNNYLKRQSHRDTTYEEVADLDIIEVEVDSDETSELKLTQQIQRELQGETTVSAKRGRPRKEPVETEQVELGVRRGRGRPRKQVDESQVVEVGIKRGRGRPRKVVDESELNNAETGVKRGRGRPRKEPVETEQVELGVKRGRGRPRKEVDESQVVEVGEKRGRGRPRKIVDESELNNIDTSVKRGRGRPRKEPVETEQVEIGEKRGRGRPRKVETEQTTSTIDERNKFIDNLTSGKLISEENENFEDDYDLFKSNIRNIFIGKEVSTQSYGQGKSNETKKQLQLAINPSQEEDDFEPIKVDTNEEFEAEQLVKQEIVELEDEISELEDDILHQESNEDVPDNNDEIEVKRGRGRPRKQVDESQVVEVGEKRGRGRPPKEKIEVEEIDLSEKRGRGRPRVNPVSSLTRSLSSPGLAHSSQEIMFASKNVTTTNININVTKTTTSMDDNKEVVNDYSHNASMSTTEHKVEVAIPTSTFNKEEIDVESEKDIEQKTNLGLGTPSNNFKDFDDDDFDDDDLDDVDDEDIKDEAPKGGIEDLLKALLDN